MRHSTHSGNPDFNSRKVTGQRTTTTSIRLGKSSICDEAYRDWYENTHPQPHSFDQAIEYWINRRRQLKRCQANPPLSYEVFLHANQPAEGHPANDTDLGLWTTVPTAYDPSPGRARHTEMGYYRGRRRQLPHPNCTIGQAARHRCHQYTIDISTRRSIG